MRKLRVYADTSVFGGCLDEEFEAASRRFFELVHDGRFTLVLSDTVLMELENAPEEVRRIVETLPKDAVVRFVRTHEVETLRDAYLRARVVGRSCRADAEHIASASVAEADLVVSWNFKHIVHYDKIAGYQGVNILMGYEPIRIFSPSQVV